MRVKKSVECRSQLVSRFLLLATRELRDEAERAGRDDAGVLFHLARHTAQLASLSGTEKRPDAAVLARIADQARSWSAASIAVDLPGFRRQTALWLDSVLMGQATPADAQMSSVSRP